MKRKIIALLGFTIVFCINGMDCGQQLNTSQVDELGRKGKQLPSIPVGGSSKTDRADLKERNVTFNEKPEVYLFIREQQTSCAKEPQGEPLLESVCYVILHLLLL